MKPELGDKQRLEHILASILLIESFIEGLDFNNFKISRIHQAATERELEIIGEASANISDDLKEKYPNVEWRPIKRFRNVIAHEYFGVSVQIVWGVVFKEIPQLKIQIQQILTDLST